MNKKPLLISFEGGEGAGKTTLITSIEKYLIDLGYPLIKTREPGGTPLGEKVRDILLHQEDFTICPMSELMLFLTSRAQQIHDVIQPALDQGKVVLLDRYNESSIAYQGAARGLGIDQVQSICESVCCGLKPDITFILSLDPKIGFKRVSHRSDQQDRMEREKLEFHQKVHKAYQTLAQKEPQRICLLDASLDKETVLDKALMELKKRLSI